MVYNSKYSESLCFLYPMIQNMMLTIEKEKVKLHFMSSENLKMDQRLPLICSTARM